MTIAIKVAIFLIFAGLLGKVILGNTQPITGEPCDYKECPTCPFPCERHRK